MIAPAPSTTTPQLHPRNISRVPNEVIAASEFLAELDVATTNLPRRAKYLIGVSGGIDSTALLHGLLLLGFRHLVVCHLDHRLRGGVAAADAIFVQKLARKLRLKSHLGKADVASEAQESGASIEAAARCARHRFFADCAAAERCNRIFLAHHADDQLETVIHHFFRGSGKRGLGGMHADYTLSVGRRKLRLLRPLLRIPKRTIMDWVKQERLPWREDASNSSPVHSRNRIRHELIPALEKILGRNFRAPVLRLAEIFQCEEDFFEQLLREQTVSAEKAELPVAELRDLHEALQRRIVLRWLQNRGIPDAGFQEVMKVLSLLNPDPTAPAKVNLPGSLHARRSRGKIFLTAAS